MISGNCQWEFRTTGHPDNSGGFVAGASGIDYSQNDASNLIITDLVIDAVLNTKVSSALTPFTSNHVGNILRIKSSAGFTAGLYEILSVTAGVATLDRAAGTVGSAGGTGRVGGAIDVPTNADMSPTNHVQPGQKIWLKNGTYNLTGSMTLVATGTAVLPIEWEGYNATRGDIPVGASRPTLAAGANQLSFGWYTNFRNMMFTITQSFGVQLGVSSKCIDCKFTGNSVSSTAPAVSNGQYNKFIRCEITAPLCRGINSFNDAFIFACYIHDSLIGLRLGHSEGVYVINTIFKNNQTALYTNSSNQKIINNVFYGAETPTGVGIDFGGNNAHVLMNNIFYGLTTAVTNSAFQKNFAAFNNNFFNNTTDRVNVETGVSDIALNPQFVNAPGLDFRVGVNMKAAGIPGTYSNPLVHTGYTDIGAVQREEIAPVCDYPAVGDVEGGVVFDFGTKTGVFAVPAPSDVRRNTGYGNNSEFIGTLEPAPALGAINFETKLLDDAKFAFLRSSEFAETITYTPNGGSPKTIDAVVVRERLQADGPDQGRVLNRQAEIYIANDAAQGVTSVDKGNDTASFPVFVGGSAVSWKVVEVLGKDEGMWHLAVMR